MGSGEDEINNSVGPGCQGGVGQQTFMAFMCELALGTLVDTSLKIVYCHVDILECLTRG